jgi:antitoxin VapB
MPLYIKDNDTAALVGKLAEARGITKQAAVKLAVTAELARTAIRVPLRDKLSQLWAEHDLPPSTGQEADKAFFDALSDAPE